MLKTVFFATASLLASAAQAQSCDSFVGQTVPALTFDQALTRTPNVAPRGEYETTAQYEARRAVAGGTGGPLIVLKTPEDRDRFIRYDADNGRLAISRYAFHNTTFDAWTAFYGTPHATALDASTMNNLALLISQRETPHGTYEGQNAYGARWTVTRLTRTIQAIFERQFSYREGYGVGLFPGADRDPYIVGYLTMPPEEAQRVKPTLKLAFVLQPREPYIVRNEYSGRGRITVQNPYDVTENATVLIGDVQCGLVLDASNRVLGAYPTR